MIVFKYLKSAQFCIKIQPVFTCAELTLKTSEQCAKSVQNLMKTPDRRRSGVFIGDFE